MPEYLLVYWSLFKIVFKQNCYFLHDLVSLRFFKKSFQNFYLPLNFVMRKVSRNAVELRGTRLEVFDAFVKVLLPHSLDLSPLYILCDIKLQ